jgi:hypothetical protein
MFRFRKDLLATRAFVYLSALFFSTSSPTAADRTAPGALENLSTLKGNAAGPSLAKFKPDESYGRLPLAFESNQGQEDPQVKFLARGGGYTLFITGTEAVFLLKKPAERVPAHPSEEFSRPKEPPPPDILRFKLEAADTSAAFEGLERLPGISNYFIGGDSSKWLTNIPQYARVKIHGVYPGVDMVYYGSQRKLEYDFQVNPGADPQNIRVKIEGADGIQTDGEGNLILNVKERSFRLLAPRIYQEDRGLKTPIEGKYALGGNNEVAFEVKNYDKTRKLIIDPVLDYGTYLGGVGGDNGNYIAVDPFGNAYVTGDTNGSFPVTPGSVKTTFGAKSSGSMTNAFVSKLNPAGSALIYSTYLGGSGNDKGYAIAADESGNAYVTGQAGNNFPTTPGAYQTAFGGYGGGMMSLFGDAFMSKLNASGSALLYSTYLGATDIEAGDGIALDGSGAVYLTGWTYGADFPTAPGAFMPVFGSGDERDIFAAKINPAGGGSSDLVYSTFLGECSSNVAPQGSMNNMNIAADSDGNAYVVGATTGHNFTTTPGAYRTVFLFGGIGDNYVLKLNPTGSGLIFSTYVGPSAGYGGYGMALDSSRNVYFAATGESTNYPTTSGAYDPTYTSSWVVGVVGEVSADGSSLLYSTFTGQTGNAASYARGIALDDCGNIYVAGFTSYSGFPVTPDAWTTTMSPINFAGYFMVLDPSQTGKAQLLFSSFLGNTINNECSAMAKDAAGNMYVAGNTNGGFPTTSGSYQPTFGGGACCYPGDAFVAKIDITSICGVVSTPTPTPAFSTTPTYTPTKSPTPTHSPMLTETPTRTPTHSPTLSPTGTPTGTPTVTMTPTATFTATCEIHVWPNPYDRKNAMGGQLKVGCLPLNATVSFFTVSGEYVQKLQASEGMARWDGVNRYNVPASSGIYYYVIQDGEKVLQKGKFLVIQSP